ncbi:MAG: A/G-specific adenine glycosylase [Treponema sp.]|nr:A/G-specific adenine glycosylase [Treponema sp.]
MNRDEIEGFRKTIYNAYEKMGRSFPWRENIYGYYAEWGILVSEIMLQQTQTSRVVPFWEQWMEKWPTPAHMKKASLQEVLQAWSGLGYNRRARSLLECAEIITRKFGGRVPDTPAVLENLPGIGAYTAGAIACFAYNYPAVLIETNIRAVMLHFFFENEQDVKDRQIMPLLDLVLDRTNPRVWNWAMMDYGAELKKFTPNPNHRSAHYTQQTKFEGSIRQIRGSLIRQLSAKGAATAEELRAGLDVRAEKEDFYKALEALGKELMVAERSGVYSIKPIGKG